MRVKKFIVSGLALILIGAAVVLVSMAMVGFDVSMLGYQGYEICSASFEADFRTVVLDDTNVNVEISQGGEELTLEYYEREKEYYVINESDSTLEIKKISSPQIGIALGGRRPTIKLKLPKSFTGTLELDCSGGSVVISGVELKELEVESSNGQLSVSSSSIETVTYEGSDAMADFVTNILRSFEGELSNGSFMLLDCSLEGSVKLEGSNSMIDLQSVTTPNHSISIESMNGVIRLDDVTAMSTVLRGRNGNIVISSVDTRDLFAETRNGDIVGTLPGESYDYKIEAKATNGSSNLTGGNEPPTVDKTLHLETNNGNIQIEFAGESEDDEEYVETHW